MTTLRHFHHALRSWPYCLKACVPLAVRSIDCFPDPRRECTPGTHDGFSLSRIGPICLQIRSKWSGAICLLAATCRGKRDVVKWQQISCTEPTVYQEQTYTEMGIKTICNATAFALCSTSGMMTKCTKYRECKVTSQGLMPKNRFCSCDKIVVWCILNGLVSMLLRFNITALKKTKGGLYFKCLYFRQFTTQKRIFH